MIDEINEAIAAVAERTGATTIDLRAPMRGHQGWFPDAIHPNDEGAAGIARVVHEALRSTGLPVSP